jgi:hypothetical protein
MPGANPGKSEIRPNDSPNPFRSLKIVGPDKKIAATELRGGFVLFCIAVALYPLHPAISPITLTLTTRAFQYPPGKARAASPE